jgi:hypothetical protein
MLTRTLFPGRAVAFNFKVLRGSDPELLLFLLLFSKLVCTVSARPLDAFIKNCIKELRVSMKSFPSSGPKYRLQTLNRKR